MVIFSFWDFIVYISSSVFLEWKYLLTGTWPRWWRLIFTWKSIVSSFKFVLQMNIRNIIYLNCGERYEDLIDHRSYKHNLSSYEIKAWKKIQAWTGFEHMTSVIPVPWSTNWSFKPSGRWSCCEFEIYP